VAVPEGCIADSLPQSQS